MVIEKCIFSNNQANTMPYTQYTPNVGSGGALYYLCDQSTLNCSLNISGSTFISNYASVSGGALHSVTIEPTIDSSVSFANNKAAQYGP